MRDIKFRAWDKENNKMLSLTANDSITFENGKAIIYKNNQWDETEETNCCISYHNIEVIQYTGLKDKNGKDIYERDIVRIPESIYPNRYYQIKWFDNNACFGSVGVCAGNSKGFNIDYGVCNKEVEVIGNIYENPELLQEVEK